MSFTNEITANVKRYFLSGVLVVVPAILTYIVLRFLFDTIDGILQPLLHRLLGYYIPGLGLLSTLLIIILAGILTRNFIGARLYRFGEKMLTRLPIIRPVYSAAKQLLEAVAMPSMDSFKEVAMIEYPRKGSYAICFISHRVEIEKQGQRQLMATVFVPSTPTPISGMVVMVPDEDVIVLDMSIEEGVKFLVSGGVAAPSLIKEKARPRARNKNEVNR